MPAIAGIRYEGVADQVASLKKIASLIEKGAMTPKVIAAARALTINCPERDDECELEAIFQAVKYGTDQVRWLRKGMRYVADPRAFDTFSTVEHMIADGEHGVLSGDCDDATILVGSLAAALGFKVGARAWGHGRDPKGEFVHVYPVAAVPKRGPWPRGYYGTALDVTRPNGRVGWEPSGGHFTTGWIE